jgi:GNAT-family acetyltransferase (TIGR03103 family)
MEKLINEPGVTLQCGWGRLIFADMFPDAASVAQAILVEAEDQRDIAMYVVDPHLLLNCGPQDIFLDPSNTYRLWLDRYEAPEQGPVGYTIRPLKHKEELDEICRIYQHLKMVPLAKEYVWENRKAKEFTYFVAVQDDSDRILGVAMGADHQACDPRMTNTCSLWALAVDPQAELPGIGVGLVHHLIQHYKERGRECMDISVLHDNEMAIKLYEKLNFERIYVFAAKRRNRINEKLFVGSPALEGYNVYASIIINEALRRGIAVDPLDPKRGYFRLSLGGRSVLCWESLSAMTSALALIRAGDKQHTQELLSSAGLKTPAQVEAGSPTENLRFLNKHKSVVVKPLQGEQGQGISVDVRAEKSLEKAVRKAKKFSEAVLLEKYVEGDDLRIIVIDGEVVAAAVRRAPTVIGDGRHTIRELVERLSRRRSAATDGESRIPVDEETERCVRISGHSLDDILEQGVDLPVRKTANLHTGGSIHDVTPDLHPDLADAAIRAARVLEIPVVGLDMIVEDPSRPEYVIIEANERPGLANHEPQPTAQKFIDFLFPQSITNLSDASAGR